jgi:CBS domain-containing protein
MTPTTVADAMTRDPVTVTPKYLLKDAIQTLAEHHISGVPVVF